MCKKGVTLIETVVYLALLTVVSLIFMGSISYYKQRQREVAYERELESIKEFIILQTIKSNNEKSLKRLNIAKNQIYDRDTKEQVKLSSLEINVEELVNKQILIQKGEITQSFILTLKGDDKIVYKIQNCTSCKKLHI
ncbi:MAG: pilus assembly FimT family protein [Sarcina sp.]